MASKQKSVPVPLIVLLSAKRAIVGIDRQSGEILWQTSVPFMPSDFIAAEEAIYCEGTGEICALDYTGQLLWHNPLRGFGQHAVMVLPGLTKARVT